MLKLIIPTCGPQPVLRDMIVSLARHTPACGIALVVNTDDLPASSAAMAMATLLVEEGFDLHFLWIPDRIGYVAACNWGWKLLHPADADDVVVLNDDMVFEGRWVEPLQDALAKGASLAGPSLKPLGADGFWGQGRYQYIEGWCLMAKAKTLREAAGLRRFSGLNGAEHFTRMPSDWLFDPGFMPQLCEDCDLGIRVVEGGGTLAEVPLPITHLRHETTGKDREPYWSRNRARLQHKWNLS